MTASPPVGPATAACNIRIKATNPILLVTVFRVETRRAMRTTSHSPDCSVCQGWSTEPGVFAYQSYTVALNFPWAPVLITHPNTHVDSLATVSGRDANFVTTGGPILWDHKWWQSWHNDHSRLPDILATLSFSAFQCTFQIFSGDVLTPKWHIVVPN